MWWDERKEMHCGAVDCGSHGAHGNEVLRARVVELDALDSGSHAPHGNLILDALHPIYQFTTQYKLATSQPHPGNSGHWNSASALLRQHSRG